MASNKNITGTEVASNKIIADKADIQQGEPDSKNEPSNVTTQVTNRKRDLGSLISRAGLDDADKLAKIREIGENIEEQPANYLAGSDDDHLKDSPGDAPSDEEKPAFDAKNKENLTTILFGAENDPRFRKPADESLLPLWQAIMALSIDALDDDLLPGLSANWGDKGVSHTGLWANRESAQSYFDAIAEAVGEFAQKNNRTDIIVFGAHNSGMIVDKILTDFDSSGNKRKWLEAGDTPANPEGLGLTGDQLMGQLAAPVAGHSLKWEYQGKKKVPGSAYYDFKGPCSSKRNKSSAHRLPGFLPTVGTIEDLIAHHAAGFTWCSAIRHPHDGRKSPTTLGGWVVALDIDSGLAIEKALELPLFKNHGCGIAESSSSSEKFPKYRVFFKVPADRPLVGDSQVSQVVSWLMGKWEEQAKKAGFNKDAQADTQCKDSSRLFFGGKDKAIFAVDGAKNLRTNIVDLAEKLSVKSIQKYEQKAIKGLEGANKKNDTDYKIEDVISALGHLRPREQGTDQYQILNHLVKSLVNTVGAELATEILQKSPLADAPGENWTVQGAVERVTSYTESIGNKGARAGIGVLFSICRGQLLHINGGKIDTSHMLNDRGPWMNAREIEGVYQVLETHCDRTGDKKALAFMKAWIDEPSIKLLTEIGEQFPEALVPVYGSPETKDLNAAIEKAREEAIKADIELSGDDSGRYWRGCVLRGERMIGWKNDYREQTLFDLIETTENPYQTLFKIDSDTAKLLEAMINEPASTYEAVSQGRPNGDQFVTRLLRINGRKRDWLRATAILAVIEGTDPDSLISISMAEIILDYYLNNCMSSGGSINTLGIIIWKIDELIASLVRGNVTNKKRSTDAEIEEAKRIRERNRQWIGFDFDGPCLDRFFNRIELPSSSAHMADYRSAARQGDNYAINELNNALGMLSKGSDGKIQFTEIEDHVHLCNEFNREYYVSIKSAKKFPYVVRNIAENNIYNGPKLYLEGVMREFEADGMTIEEAKEIVDTFGETWFKRPDSHPLPMLNAYLRTFLGNCIRLVYEPGCYIRESLVLIGLAGVGKTTFARVMGGEFYMAPDGVPVGNEKAARDLRMDYAAGWICLVDEVDQYFPGGRRGDVKSSALKSIATCDSLTYVAPYAHSKTKVKRMFNLMMATNNYQLPFLKGKNALDGRDRYMVIPFGDESDPKVDKAWPKLNHEALKRERDRIWAAFTMIYRDLGGEYFALSTEEKDDQMSDLENYSEISSLSERVEYLAEKLGWHYRVFRLAEVSMALSAQLKSNDITDHNVKTALKTCGFGTTRNVTYEQGGNRGNRGWVHADNPNKTDGIFANAEHTITNELMRGGIEDENKRSSLKNTLENIEMLAKGVDIETVVKRMSHHAEDRY